VHLDLGGVVRRARDRGTLAGADRRRAAATVTALQLFIASLAGSSRVCLVGGTRDEEQALAGHRIENFNYASTGRRYEVAPFRPEMYDGLYCAHTLEHMRNPGLTLDRFYCELKPGGLLAIVVPPLKHEIVGGHLSLWNAGLLLYNLVRARFDCSKAAVRTYDYNAAVVVRKVRAEYVDNMLLEDNGDLERLAAYFPVRAVQGFDGRIEAVNWSPR